MMLLTIPGVTKILCSFKLVLEGKAVQRCLSYQNFSANNFAFLDAEDNTSRPLNRGGIADLPLLRTLLAIHQTSQEPGFWEVIDSFVLLAYASLTASRTLLQWLLACLKFTLESEDLFYELWQQHKQLKTMEMSQA